MAGEDKLSRFALENSRRVVTLPAFMPLLALTTLEKIQQLPPRVWMNVALGVLGFLLVVLVLRSIAQMNKLLLGGVALLVLIVLGMQWIYERNEPDFLTPVMDRIAPFFPSKGKPPAPAGQPAAKPAR
jgi:hypothetical protein